MSGLINDGGPAFPGQAYGADGLPASSCEEGMSLRDYIAIKAMQGILAGPCSRDRVPASEWFDIPEQAYKLADLMLKSHLATNGGGVES